MITKLIAAAIVAGLLFVGWEIFLYWDKVKNQRENEAKEQAAALQVNPQQLPGMPYGLDASYEAAKKQGAAGLAAWLKSYGHLLQDPRRAWIEVDYAMLLSRDNPSEAKRVFAAVKSRTPTNSPVYPRIKKLEKTYE